MENMNENNRDEQRIVDSELDTEQDMLNEENVDVSYLGVLSNYKSDIKTAGDVGSLAGIEADRISGDLVSSSTEEFSEEDIDLEVSQEDKITNADTELQDQTKEGPLK